MPTRKISEATSWSKLCKDPDHNPPSMIVYEPGQYEHVCPKCGKVQIFTVSKKFFSL